MRGCGAGRSERAGRRGLQLLLRSTRQNGINARNIEARHMIGHLRGNGGLLLRLDGLDPSEGGRGHEEGSRGGTGQECGGLGRRGSLAPHSGAGSQSRPCGDHLCGKGCQGAVCRDLLGLVRETRAPPRLYSIPGVKCDLSVIQSRPALNKSGIEIQVDWEALATLFGRPRRRQRLPIYINERNQRRGGTHLPDAPGGERGINR